VSELQQVLVALGAVSTEADRHAAAMTQTAHRIGAASQQAAAVARGSSRGDGVQVAAALERAQRSVVQAAQLLHAAAQAGRGFVGRYGGVAGGAPAAGGSVVPGGAVPAAARTAGVHGLPGLPPGFAMVPVELIDQAENPISGPEDFGKGYSIEDLEHAFTLLEGQVLPSLADGVDPSAFSAADQAGGAYGTRSLADTYAGFFGGDAIRLELRPDGRYGITNGRHRIFVASRYGRSFVPARLS
jgi:hypothetical protein